MTCNHQTVSDLGKLPQLIVNLHTPLVGPRQMALRRITYEGIYVGSAGGIVRQNVMHFH